MAAMGVVELEAVAADVLGVGALWACRRNPDLAGGLVVDGGLAVVPYDVIGCCIVIT